MGRIPPPALLQTVEVVVRLGSFKRAAEELGLTPSAVSHRIRSIEAMAGHPIFAREGQGILPGAQALAIARIVGRANDELTVFWGQVITRAKERKFKITCMPGFADHYIFPNIADFKQRFPQLDLAITSSTNLDADVWGKVDMMIGLGLPPDREWQTHKLMDFVTYPIVRNDVFEQIIQDGVLKGPILGYLKGAQDWETVARALGCELHPDAQTIFFDSVKSAASAAASGAGLALVPLWAAEEAANNGNIKLIRHAPVVAPNGYWFAVRRELGQLSVVERFQKWLETTIKVEVVKPEARSLQAGYTNLQ